MVSKQLAANFRWSSSCHVLLISKQKCSLTANVVMHSDVPVKEM